MNNQELMAYRRHRRDGLRAETAHALAIESRIVMEAPFNIYDENPEWEQDGFTLKLKVYEDEGPDTSYLGTFDNNWKEGCIEHEPDNHRTHRYFHPGISEEEHYRDLIDCHCGRVEARQLAKRYVQRNYERACSFGTDWHMIAVSVKAYWNDIELASSGTGNVESDCSKATLVEIALELADQALHEAKNNLAGLCAS